MFTIYGSHQCPHCRACLHNLDTYRIPYEFVEILSDLPSLKGLLRLRDSSPIFDDAKEKGAIGIPVLVREDGTLTRDWEDEVRALGFEVLPDAPEACDVKGKSC